MMIREKLSVSITCVALLALLDLTGCSDPGALSLSVEVDSWTADSLTVEYEIRNDTMKTFYLLEDFGGYKPETIGKTLSISFMNEYDPMIGYYVFIMPKVTPIPRRSFIQGTMNVLLNRPDGVEELICVFPILGKNIKTTEGPESFYASLEGNRTPVQSKPCALGSPSPEEGNPLDANPPLKVEINTK